MATDVSPQKSGRGGRGRAATTFGSLLAGTLGASALTLVLALRIGSLLAGHAGPWRVDAAVEAGATSVGLLVAAWLASCALLATTCLLVRAAGTTWRTGERLVHHYAPQVVRKALVLAVGAGVGLGMASGATAAPPEPVPASSPGWVTTDAPVDLGWVVTVPSVDLAEAVPTVGTLGGGGATAVAEPAAPAPIPDLAVATSVLPSTAVPDDVVVAAGDSLWAIAARHLPPGATDAEIATAWPRWYEANSAVIGADPDLIEQGQVLVAPSVDEVAR